MFNWLTDFAKKFKKTAAPLVTEAAAVTQTLETKPTAKDPLSPRERYHARSGRTDGGGKHWGSKRFYSNHRGSGSGKRSGRQ